MTTTTFDEPPRDPLCGCRVVRFAANRRDRREAARRGLVPTSNVTRHRRDCRRAGKALSDAGRTDPPQDAA